MELKKKLNGFMKSNKTVFGQENRFRNLLENQLDVIMCDSRERMLQHENAFFGMVGAKNLRSMEDAQELIGNASVGELMQIFKNKTIGNTGVYLLPENQIGENQLLVGGTNGDNLGFISLRDNSKDMPIYSLGRTSTVFDKPAFSTNNGGPVILHANDTNNDIIMGRLYLGDNHHDIQELKINNKNDDLKFDIDLKLTGYERIEEKINRSRGLNPGENYRKFQEVRSTHWKDSKNPSHHYDLLVKVVGL